MSEKHLTVLIVPHDERNVRRIRLSYRRLKALAVIGLVLFGLALAAILSYGRIATRATRAAMLERRNEKLSAENEKVERIAANLERSERAYRRIRSLAGLPPPEAEDSPRVEESPRAMLETLLPTSAEASGGSSKPSRANGSAVPSGWPLAIKGFVTSRFSGGEGHPGIDIAAPVDTPVVATAKGVVRSTGADPVYGNFVVIDHGSGLVTMYAHNAMVLVEQGDAVERGETIASSGNSGESTAPHLHYEIRRDGEPIAPDPYLE